MTKRGRMKYIYQLITFTIGVLGIALVLSMAGCGSDTVYVDREVIKEVEIPGPEVVKKIRQKFEGLYYFKESGSGAISGPLELTVHYDGKVTAYQASNNARLVSRNFNDTFGTHPKIKFDRAKPTENAVYYSADINYSNSDDLEEDGSNSNLGAGKKYTRYEFRLLNNGLLRLKIYIHEEDSNNNGGINKVVIERTFTEVQ